MHHFIHKIPFLLAGGQQKKEYKIREIRRGGGGNQEGKQIKSSTRRNGDLVEVQWGRCRGCWGCSPVHQQRGSRRLFNINERFNEVGSVGLYHHSVLRVCGSVCVGEREGERKKERKRKCACVWNRVGQLQSGSQSHWQPCNKKRVPGWFRLNRAQIV